MHADGDAARTTPSADETQAELSAFLEQLRAQAADVERAGDLERLMQAASFLDDMAAELTQPLPDDLKAFAARYRPPAA